MRSWTGVCFLSLSPPTSGLAQRGCSAGGCWTGSLLSTPLAADFGPAPEGAAYSRHFICFPCRPLLRARLGGDGEGAYGQRVCRGGPEKRGTGANTTFPRFRNHSDFTGSQQIDQDSPRLAGPLAQLARHWSLLRPASLSAQPVPRGQTTWSTALSWLDGPSDTTSRLSVLGCTAGAVVPKHTWHTFTHSIFHSLASRREAKICSVTGLNTI